MQCRWTLDFYITFKKSLIDCISFPKTQKRLRFPMNLILINIEEYSFQVSLLDCKHIINYLIYLKGIIKFKKTPKTVEQQLNSCISSCSANCTVKVQCLIE